MRKTQYVNVVCHSQSAVKLLCIGPLLLYKLYVTCPIVALIQYDVDHASGNLVMQISGILNFISASTYRI